MRRFLITMLALFFATMAQAEPQYWQGVWSNTDFSKTSVPWKEIESGGPTKDGIPAIDEPRFVKASEDEVLKDREPVMVVEMAGQARAYPIRYLMWHEIVNDKIGNVPFTVTYCPLCNSGLVFDGRLNGKTYTFGVSGKLRNSDMVMYDRQTESWWQQFIGEGIVGEMTGKKLKKLPGWMESWASFEARNPDGLVMQQPRYRRNYGANPYRLYDTSSSPFLYRGENPPHGIKPLMRVVSVGDTAWPFDRLAKEGVVEENGLRIEWTSGMASALDKYDISKSRDVGAIRVKDVNSGKDVAHDVGFAFAFHAFHPDGEWMLGN